MGLFGKKKEKKPEGPEEVSIKGYRLFKYPTSAGAFAAGITEHWTFQGPWADGGDPNADAEALAELMDMASENDFPYEAYVVRESDGSLGVLVDWDWDADEEEMADELDEGAIEWVALV